MDIYAFIGTILTPIKWVIEALLVGWHWVWTNLFGLDPAAGITWVLSIVGLVLATLAFTGVFICCRRLILYKPSNPRHAVPR